MNFTYFWSIGTIQNYGRIFTDGDALQQAYSNKLCMIINVTLLFFVTTGRDLKVVGCSYGLLDHQNRFLLQFCDCFSGANFYPTPFCLRDIDDQSWHTFGVLEHRCTFWRLVFTSSKCTTKRSRGMRSARRCLYKDCKSVIPPFTRHGYLSFSVHSFKLNLEVTPTHFIHNYKILFAQRSMTCHLRKISESASSTCFPGSS